MLEPIEMVRQRSSSLVDNLIAACSLTAMSQPRICKECLTGIFSLFGNLGLMLFLRLDPLAVGF
jgi:hypothetical protein